MHHGVSIRASSLSLQPWPGRPEQHGWKQWRTFLLLFHSGPALHGLGTNSLIPKQLDHSPKKTEPQSSPIAISGTIDIAIYSHYFLNSLSVNTTQRHGLSKLQCTLPMVTGLPFQAAILKFSSTLSSKSHGASFLEQLATSG